MPSEVYIRTGGGFKKQSTSEFFDIAKFERRALSPLHSTMNDVEVKRRARSPSRPQSAKAIEIKIQPRKRANSVGSITDSLKQGCYPKTVISKRPVVCDKLTRLFRPRPKARVVQLLEPKKGFSKKLCRCCSFKKNI